MVLTFQVTFDCANPDRLARFWADVLGYKLADPPNGFDSWDAFLDSIGVPPEDRDGASAVVDPEGNQPRMYFQRVPEAKSVKNRIHLDINITPGMRMPLEERVRLVDEAAERFVSLGATLVRRTQEYGGYYVVLQDPEGNEFCAH
jgi:catechol 2,3-dioxygenase-like lactoylglutathione lyase family enzyme